MWNEIHGNDTSGNGGGVYTAASSSLISGNRIYENRADDTGGGVYCYEAGAEEPIVANNSIYRNEAGNFGGGIACKGSDAIVTNNTVHGNVVLDTVDGKGGGLYLLDSSAETRNSIFMDNQARRGPDMAIEWESPFDYYPYISHTLVKGGPPKVYIETAGGHIHVQLGGGLITDDPRFFNAAQDDFHLSWGSLCINAGDPAAPGVPVFDLDGNSRHFSDNVVDLGSDEFIPLRVPEDYATIQEAIDAAGYRETVVVAPGVYHERIDFNGKAVTVKGIYGNGITLLDGDSALEPVVTFSSGEGPESILDGFTIANGSAIRGAGIFCSGSSPTIINNRVTCNAATEGGGGIYSEAGSPLVNSNIIVCNEAYRGAGLWCHDGSSIVLTSNTIWGNDASGEGGGIACTTGSYLRAANTVLWNNTGVLGPEMVISGGGDPAQVDISFCDVEGGTASVYVETGSTLNWGNGMIDADPMYYDPDGLDGFLETWADNDFHMPITSPCLDMGDDAAEGMMPRDFDGNPRISNVTDIGADEFYPYVYCFGEFVPNGEVALMQVGPPGSLWTMTLTGSGVADIPTNTPMGWLWLLPPINQLPINQMLLPTGINKVLGDIPATPPGPYLIPIQSVLDGELTDINAIPVE